MLTDDDFQHATLLQRLVCVKSKKNKQCIALSELHHTATGNRIPYGITQCYVPHDRGDFLSQSWYLATLE